MAPQGFKRAGEVLFVNIVEMVRRASRPWPGTASSSVLAKRFRSAPSRSMSPAMVTGSQASIACGGTAVWTLTSCSGTVSFGDSELRAMIAPMLSYLEVRASSTSDAASSISASVVKRPKLKRIDASVSSAD